jgi:hypothetical protein
LLSSLNVAIGAAEIRVERNIGKEHQSRVNLSNSMLEGTAMYVPGNPSLPGDTVSFYPGIAITSGTGTVKPFGRVTIVDEGRDLSGLPRGGGGSDNTAPGPIFLASAKGHMLGLLFLFTEEPIVGPQQDQFQLLKAGAKYVYLSRPIARGTLNVSFPQGPPGVDQPTAPFAINF